MTPNPPSILSNTQLQDYVKDYLNNSMNAIPAGQRGAVYVFKDNTGIRFGSAAKIGDTWQVSGDVHFEPHDGLHPSQWGLGFGASW